jgi:anti-sigma B factor antagonist
MRIQQRMVGEVAIIDLNGKLTLGDGDELLRDKVNRLIQQGQKKIVLNLADVPYMDSAGLGEVVRTYTTALNHGGGLKLLRPTKRVKDLFIITKIWTILEAFESEDDAIRSFPPSTGV